MSKNSKLIEGRFIYVTEVRYHTLEYPYRLAVEDKGDELYIFHQSKFNGDEEWTVTHSIGIKKQDLIKILESIK